MVLTLHAVSGHVDPVSCAERKQGRNFPTFLVGIPIGGAAFKFSGSWKFQALVERSSHRRGSTGFENRGSSALQ